MLDQEDKDAGCQEGPVHAMANPLQALGMNLHFLCTSHARMAALLGLHRASMGNYPRSVAERLKRAEETLDVEFFELESPKVLEEMEEGLARLTALAASLSAVVRGEEDGHGC